MQNFKLFTPILYSAVTNDGDKHMDIWVHMITRDLLARNIKNLCRSGIIVDTIRHKTKIDINY